MTKIAKVKVGITWFLTLSPFIWFALFFLFHLIVLSPKAKESQKALQTELSIIAPPKESQLEETGASHKTNHASAYNRYAISWSPEEIFNYYDVELAKHGWSVFDQRNSVVIGKTYCKGNYTASLDYYKVGYSWKYELWLSAGQTSECEMVKGGGFAYIPLSDLWFSLACSTSWLILWIPIGLASWIPKNKEFDRSGVWRSRIFSTIIVIICLFVFLLSIYKIMMFIKNA